MKKSTDAPDKQRDASETNSVHGLKVSIALMGNTTTMTATAQLSMHWRLTINRRSFTGPHI